MSIGFGPLRHWPLLARPLVNFMCSASAYMMMCMWHLRIVICMPMWIFLSEWKAYELSTYCWFSSVSIEYVKSLLPMIYWITCINFFIQVFSSWISCLEHLHSYSSFATRRQNGCDCSLLSFLASSLTVKRWWVAGFWQYLPCQVDFIKKFFNVLVHVESYLASFVSQLSCLK